MNREDFERYHQNGGDYIIPVEVFNSIFDERDDLIKCLEDKIKESENTLEKLEGTGSFRIAVEQAIIRNCEDFLEKVKSGRYE